MVFVVSILALCSLITGHLILRLRRERGSVPIYVYVIGLASLTVCAYYASLILFAFASMSTIMTAQIAGVLAVTVIGGLFSPVALEVLAERRREVRAQSEAILTALPPVSPPPRPTHRMQSRKVHQSRAISPVSRFA